MKNFTLLNNLVKKVIIGLKVLKQHQSITLDFEGKDRPLNFKYENESHLSVVYSNVKIPLLFPDIDKSQNQLKCLQENIFKRKETSLRKKSSDCRKTTLLMKAFHHGIHHV